MEKLLLVTAVICAASAAHSDELGEALKRKFPTAEIQPSGTLTFEYENFYFDPERGRARIIVKLKNDTATAFDMVILECAFLNKDMNAVDTATLVASNVSPGTSAYASAWSERMVGIEHAECRISSSR